MHADDSKQEVVQAGERRFLAGRRLTDFGDLSKAEEKLLKAVATGTPLTLGHKIPRRKTQRNVVRGDFLRFLLLGGDDFAPIDPSGITIWGAYIHGVINLLGAEAVASLNLSHCFLPNELVLIDAKVPGVSLTASYVSSLYGDRLNCAGGFFVRRGSTIRVLHLGGAWIGGDLDLSGSTIGTPPDPHREGGPRGWNPGPPEDAIMADGARVVGDFFCRDAQSFGCVRLAGGSVGGDLSLRGTDCDGLGGSSLIFDRTQFGGAVFLTANFSSKGGVHFSGARIKGALECVRASLNNDKSDYALIAERVHIEGSLLVADNTTIVGMFNLRGAKIDGDAIFLSSCFEGSDDSFIGTSMTVKGGLIWKCLDVYGAVYFDQAEANSFSDDEESYAHLTKLALDGFRYSRIIDAPTSANFRIGWLCRQTLSKASDFWPQPWEHLARVLKEMGHFEEAKIVLIQKQKEIRGRGLIGNRVPRAHLSRWRRLSQFVWLPVSNIAAKLSHTTYGALASYGYRPMRTVLWMVGAWALGTAVYSWGEARGLFGPTAPALLVGQQFSDCGAPGTGTPRWTRCNKLPRAYTTFDPPIYSLDVILPLVDLKQEGDWGPIVDRGQGWSMWDGMLVRGVMWAEIMFGWIGSLLLVSAVGRLVQKD